jgi:hypothetical protein
MQVGIREEEVEVILFTVEVSLWFSHFHPIYIFLNSMKKARSESSL